MQLRAYTDFSLRVLMFAALCGNRRATVDEVSETFGVSRNHIVKIVHNLGIHGYLDTQRGIGGGFSLARPANKIGIGKVVRVCEESSTVIDCYDRKEGPCCIQATCLLKGVLDEAAGAFFEVLDRYTLANLVTKRSGLRKLLSL